MTTSARALRLLRPALVESTGPRRELGSPALLQLYQGEATDSPLRPVTSRPAHQVDHCGAAGAHIVVLDRPP
jgi:hypothetical protein